MNVDVRICSLFIIVIVDFQEDEDGVYFSLYGYYGIYEEMLKVREEYKCIKFVLKEKQSKIGF